MAFTPPPVLRYENVRKFGGLCGVAHSGAVGLPCPRNAVPMMDKREISSRRTSVLYRSIRR
jgi:hypothetical protein